MVIVQLTGGLGNQLFQYAAAKSLSLFKKTALKVDADFFNNQDFRSLDLNYFILHFDIASKEEVSNLQAGNIFSKAFQRSLPPHKRTAYREPYFHFDSNFFNAKKDVYLKGNWQSEKYFKPFENEIRNEFLIKEKFISPLENLAREIDGQSSVSVHIRRGDYLHPKTLAYHGILTKEYYNNAIEVVAKKLSNPTFYFFSDDINWVEENINLSYPHRFMSGQITKSAIEDFYLMQSCQHNIIANSSFSWWAAWLNKNSRKIVVAPKDWFNQGPNDTYDLIPEGWLKL